MRESGARRNKDIAHFDHATQIEGLRKAVGLLPGPSRQEIDLALVALRNFMERVFRHFEGKIIDYNAFSFHDGTPQLLQLLKRGTRYDELVDAGAIDPADLAERPYFAI